jgi:hypothetical protein
MCKFSLAASAVLLGISLGCGGGPPSTSDPGKPPPHGGTLVNLPGGAGMVEVVHKGGSASAKSVTGEVSFYFFKDAYTPFSPSPSAGTLALANAKKVELKSEGETLVTPPGPPLFKTGAVDGTLTVQLDGTTKTIPLGVR